MDDIKIWVYILFGIIYVVSRALKSSKKRRAAHQPPIPTRQEEVPSTPKTPATSLEDLLKEFGVDIPEQKPEPEYEPEPEVVEEYKPEPFKSVSHHNTRLDTELTSKLSGIEATVQAPDVDHDDPYHEEPAEASPIAKLLHSKRGIRDAIILNEVLNRKY